MAALTTISVFVGAALGLRFKVFILVPMISFALALIAVSGALRGKSIWDVTVPMAVVATCTQLGYIIALLVVEGSVLWSTFKGGEVKVIGDEPGNTDYDPEPSGKAAP
jgi:hypothetical protein